MKGVPIYRLRPQLGLTVIFSLCGSFVDAYMLCLMVRRFSLKEKSVGSIPTALAKAKTQPQQLEPYF